MFVSDVAAFLPFRSPDALIIPLRQNLLLRFHSRRVNFAPFFFFYPSTFLPFSLHHQHTNV